MVGTVNAPRLIVLPFCGVPVTKKRGCCPLRLPLVGVPSKRLPASWPLMVKPSSVGLPELTAVTPDTSQLSNTTFATALPPPILLGAGRSQTKFHRNRGGGGARAATGAR